MLQTCNLQESMSNFSDLRSRVYIAVCLIAVVMSAAIFRPMFLVCIVLVMSFVTMELFPSSLKSALPSQRKIALRVLVLVISVLAFVAMADLYARNQYDVALIVACAALADSGCYFTGRIIGGPKLPASISPNKTYAGLCGGFALVNIVYYSVACMIAPYISPISCWQLQVLIFAAIAGDLLESKFKRILNIKDMSALLAGHGGVLDRADSTILATLAFWAMV